MVLFFISRRCCEGMTYDTMSNIKYKLVFSSKVIYTNNFAAFHRVYFERKNRWFLVNRRNMRHNLSTVPMWQFRSWLQFQYSTGRSDSSGYTHTTKFVKTYIQFSYFLVATKTSKKSATSTAGENVTIVHLTDFHYDALYSEGSSSICTDEICCRNASSVTIYRAGKMVWPWILIENKQIRST